MSDLPEVDTLKAFFVLLVGAVIGSLIMYAWDQTVGRQINMAIAKARTARTA